MFRTLLSIAVCVTVWHVGPVHAQEPAQQRLDDRRIQLAQGLQAQQAQQAQQVQQMQQVQQVQQATQRAQQVQAAQLLQPRSTPVTPPAVRAPSNSINTGREAMHCVSIAGDKVDVGIVRDGTYTCVPN
jgi:glucose/arabinose dehydrogenase